MFGNDREFGLSVITLCCHLIAALFGLIVIIQILTDQKIRYIKSAATSNTRLQVDATRSFSQSNNSFIRQLTTCLTPSSHHSFCLFTFYTQQVHLGLLRINVFYKFIRDQYSISTLVTQLITTYIIT